MGEVHPTLHARIRLEPHDSVGRRAGPHPPHVLPELRVAAGMSRRADLHQQPDRRQLRILLQAFPHDRLVRVQLGGHRRLRTVADLLEIPVQFPLVDPAIDTDSVTVVVAEFAESCGRIPAV